nr:hypothetical protein Iba_chr04aCG17380 [Ipomoea batatas]
MVSERGDDKAKEVTPKTSYEVRRNRKGQHGLTLEETDGELVGCRDGLYYLEPTSHEGVAILMQNKVVLYLTDEITELTDVDVVENHEPPEHDNDMQQRRSIRNRHVPKYLENYETTLPPSLAVTPSTPPSASSTLSLLRVILVPFPHPRVSLGGLTPLRPNTFASHSAGALNLETQKSRFSF